MLRLPAYPDRSHYSYRVALEGTVYRLRWQWNPRTEGWYVSLYTSDDTALVTGVRVVCNYPLFSELKDARLPLGMVVAVPLTEDDSDPGYTDLGGRVRVLYMEAADRAIMEADAEALASADALVIDVAEGMEV